MPPRAPSQWPGERWGLPFGGPGSIGRPGRRILALIVDWALAYSAAYLLTDTTGFSISAMFVVLQIIFIPTLGGSLGHRLLGLRVVALRGGWVGLWRPVVRSLLLALVIPAAVWDSDQRGFHDKLAGTVLVRA